jgi:hypothetical protein
VSELHGKGWRVLGYFLWMLGAGVLLDSDAVVIGTAVCAAGAALFALGALQRDGRGRPG